MQQLTCQLFRYLDVLRDLFGRTLYNFGWTHTNLALCTLDHPTTSVLVTSPLAKSKISVSVDRRQSRDPSLDVPTRPAVQRGNQGTGIEMVRQGERASAGPRFPTPDAKLDQKNVGHLVRA